MHHHAIFLLWAMLNNALLLLSALFLLIAWFTHSTKQIRNGVIVFVITFLSIFLSDVFSGLP